MFFIDIFTCDRKYIKCYKKLLFLKKIEIKWLNYIMIMIISSFKKNFLLYLKCPYLLFEKDNHRKNLKDKRNKHDYLI